MARVEPHLGAPVDIELEKLQPKFYLVKACDLEASGLTGYQDAIRPLRIAGNKNAVTARIQSIVTDKFVVMDFCLDSGERCSVPVTQYSFGENRWITFDKCFVFIPETDPVVMVDQETKSMLDQPIEVLGLMPRTHKILLTEGILTVGQLVEHSESGLSKIPNFGFKALADVLAALNARGLKLRSTGYEWLDDH